MAKLLFKLAQVPDDEADEIRQLLDQGEINFYETSPGLFGFSFAAIWLKDERQFEQANQLIEQYQAKRYASANQMAQHLKDTGQSLSRWQVMKLSPIKVPVAIIFVALLLYFSTVPFFFG